MHTAIFSAQAVCMEVRLRISHTRQLCRELVADNVIIISSSCSDYVIHVYVSRVLYAD